jgi:hypothetical protein
VTWRNGYTTRCIRRTEDDMPARLNLPNALTWLRIILIPLIVLVYYLPHYWGPVPAHWAGPGAAIIFSLAGITDWLDGYFARKLNQTSAFGAFLDPVADKLMISTALVLLVSHHPSFVVAGGDHHWPRDCGLRPARVDVRAWRPASRQGIRRGQIQDGRTDYGADHDALGAQALVHPDVRGRLCIPACGGLADPLVDVELFARRVAPPARVLSRHRARPDALVPERGRKA